MNPIVALGLVVIAGVLLYIWWNRADEEAKTGELILLKGSQPGKIRKTLSLGLPRSFNQPEGLIFSYACWILVKDFQAGYGQQRTLFSKNDAPGVYLDPTSNSILVKITTFDGVETMVIPNIPALKWVHFALVVDQDAGPDLLALPNPPHDRVGSAGLLDLGFALVTAGLAGVSAFDPIEALDRQGGRGCEEEQAGEPRARCARNHQDAFRSFHH
jgi:hypothetical protein